MRLVFFLLFLSPLVFGQEKAPFRQFNKANKSTYIQQKKAISSAEISPEEKINQRIQLASKYKAQDDLIAAFEAKIALLGENAQLRYLLGGSNGIKALQVNRMLSVSYVKEMLFNFERALVLDPSHLPALEAYIESLCMVPALLGGDLAKAKELAARLKSIDQVQAYFSLGFIAAVEQNNALATDHYKKAFNLLEEQFFCAQNLTDFFAKSAMNFPYKIAEISNAHQLSPAIGLCAINYFIEQQTPFYTLPLEWAYFQKAQLLASLGKNDAALIEMEKALEINPNFELGKSWQTKQQKAL